MIIGLKKGKKRFIATILALSVFCTSIFSSLSVLASDTVIAHLKASENNGNGHFGSDNPEAFILSDKADIKAENISFNINLLSDKEDSRVRFITKYVDDINWGYIGYDGKSNWFIEYKVSGDSKWETLSNLPAINKEDVIKVNLSYEEEGLKLTINNETSKENGTVTITNSDFLSLKEKAGRIGFGAANYENEITDINFSNVVVGDKTYTDYSNWILYDSNIQGQIWEADINNKSDNTEKPIDNTVSKDGEKWFTLIAGDNNGGGHEYSKANIASPILYLDNSRTMEEAGSISLKIKPSINWGVFYSYKDDDNWLYVGYDASSQWYYQYEIDGKGSYPKISGLPTPVEGEKLQMSIALDREKLTVKVNDKTVNITNQDLIKLAENNAGKGKFGVKTNGKTTISFADVLYNNINCMEDEWVFAAEREGQVVKEEYTKLVPVTGIVKNSNNEPIEGATVRIGANSTKTNEKGEYSYQGLEIKEYAMSITKAGYEAYSSNIKLEDKTNNIDVTLNEKAELDLSKYDTIESDEMRVYIGKNFPVVSRYQLLENGQELENQIFRGNETELDTIAINGKVIKPTVTIEDTTDDSRVYEMDIKDKEASLDLEIKVKISVKENDLIWEVIDVDKEEDCSKIATIDIPGLNLLTIDAVEEGANFAGAQASTTTTISGDSFIDFGDSFVPLESNGYLYGFLTNGNLSAGLYSNSEVEGDKRVIRNNGADTISLTSAPWYYELGDKNAQSKSKNYEDYPVSELPVVKVAIASDENEDGDIDWNDGAIAFRDIMNIPYGSEVIKDMVNYRIVMNFASMAPNPFLTTADNIKKVYLATDGLPQSVMLKGYGNEGHDSANSEYADIAEREGGVEDFQDLIKIAHDYNTEIGIHINAQEIYPEAASFNESMLQKPIANGWGWLDQSKVIDKLWDLSSQARWKRLVQLYDRINETSFFSLAWPEAVKDSQGEVIATREEIQKDAENRENNMDFIYLDVWYQDSWETRKIADEINTLGWRFTTEFSGQGEYDSTWQHWSTDAVYGGKTSKGFNSDIIRFIRNDQRDSQVLNYPEFGGTADNPLLGGYRLYGFEGWQGNKDFNNYIKQTFNENLPTKFLQHYYVIDWENYKEGESPVENHEKQITLKNDEGDRVIVTRNEEQREDSNIERIITLNNKVVLNDVKYLLPWTEEDGSEKLYHWNLEGGKSEWDLQDEWASLENIIMYELSDQGRINELSIPVVDGKITLDAKAETAYVLVKGQEVKELKHDFGEYNYVVDPGFNSYAPGEKLSKDTWSGDIDNPAIVVEKANTGDQRLAFNNPSEDVSVSTTISGLTKGKHYVAEVYVENNSNSKASIEVNAGNSIVSNYVEASILNNYVQCDPKNGSKMQRMQVSFIAEGDEATIKLSREAGEGSSYIDDIRIVEKELNNFQEDGSFKQDFETVVQGLYPFVLGPAQGISDPVTHLSQKNEPFTQFGWENRVIDDVIDGNWSLKHHGANTGIIYQTLPQNFRFEEGKVYTVEFDYQSGPDKAYAMVVGDGEKYSKPTEEQYLSVARGETKHVKMQVVGSETGQTWIGLYEDKSKAGSGSMGETDFVLDNLVITEVKN